MVWLLRVREWSTPDHYQESETGYAAREQAETPAAPIRPERGEMRGLRNSDFSGQIGAGKSQQSGKEHGRGNTPAGTAVLTGFLRLPNVFHRIILPDLRVTIARFSGKGKSDF